MASAVGATSMADGVSDEPEARAVSDICEGGWPRAKEVAVEEVEHLTQLPN